MGKSFTPFPRCPIEVRFMIWDLALPPRTVIVDHNVKDGLPVSRKQIKEQRPTLLSVNREARLLTLAKYTSVFKAPRLAWEYTGSLKSFDLRKILKTLGLPQKGTIVLMLQEVTQYMNTHVDEGPKFTKFAKFTDVSKDSIRPQWLDPKSDMLLFRYPVDLYNRMNSRDSLLWGPWKSDALKLRHIAISVDALNTAGRRYSGQRIWSKNGLKSGKISTERKSAKLESMHILVGDACEVLRIEVDRNNLLEKGEWAFSLDTVDNEFQEEMGPRWAGFTWKIILAKNDELHLWQLVKQWTPDPSLWEQDKREICRGNSKVKMLWDIAERARRFQPRPDRVAQLLEKGDGATYLGPSKLPGT